MSKPLTVTEYINAVPEEARKHLREIRAILKTVAPKAVESISYGMPGYKLEGRPLVYFGAWKNHIGFYPTPSGTAAFKKELSVYKNAKGSVQFPLDRPIPLALIKKIVQFRVKENLGK